MNNQEIIEKLEKKLKVANADYDHQEIQFLIDNIGNPNPQIRDDLVCSLLGKAFFNNEFTVDQTQYLVHEALENNLLFYHMDESGAATLTRSFTALLLQLAITTNVQADSRYFAFLSLKTCQQIYGKLIKCLRVEHDYTGFSKKYGWVHAIAHVSDALEACIRQDAFDEEYVQAFMLAAAKCLKQADRRFTAGEEHRLANVFIAGFKKQKISSVSLILWSENFRWDLNNPIEYLQFCNVKSLMEDIYIKLNKAQLLEADLKQYIEQNFVEVY